MYCKITIKKAERKLRITTYYIQARCNIPMFRNTIKKMNLLNYTIMSNVRPLSEQEASVHHIVVCVYIASNSVTSNLV